MFQYSARRRHTVPTARVGYNEYAVSPNPKLIRLMHCALVGLLLLLLLPSTAAAYQIELELTPDHPSLPLRLPPDVDLGEIEVDVLGVDIIPGEQPPAIRTFNLGGYPVEVPSYPFDEPFWFRAVVAGGAPALVLGARRFVREGRVVRVVVRVSTGRSQRVAPVPEGWPAVALAPERRLAIVTTSDIVGASAMLETYIRWRETTGFEVFVGTEEDWDQPVVIGPDDRPERIRAWLLSLEEENDLGYVLLIGDPSLEGEGGVPMKATHPLSSLLDRFTEEHLPLFNPVPTDHYYSDLRGDWDLDGDGLCGEFPDDDGLGGIRWAGDALVGRVPVYGGQLGRLDALLESIMAYEQSTTPQYRHRVLLPAAFLGFEGQPRTVFGTYIETEDAAGVAEVIGELVLSLDPLAQIVGLYEESGLVSTSFEHDLPLTTEGLIAEWSQGAGLLMTFSHGGDSEGYRSIWTDDLNDDAIADEDEVIRETFLTSLDLESLVDAPPSLAFLGACLNGNPDVSGNLGTSLLGLGSIAVVASSRAAMGGDVVDFAPSTEHGDAYTLAYTYAHLLLEGFSVGEALAYTRYGMPADGWPEPWHGAGWLGKFEFNLYGDPTVGLGLCVVDQDCEDGSLCNGPGRCIDGYCAQGALVDCSALNSDCATSTCDPATGTCDTRHYPEGIRCDDGLFCTVDDICEQGVCVAGMERVCSGADGGIESACDELFDECVEVETIEPDAGGSIVLEGSCSSCAAGAGSSSALLAILDVR